MASGRSRARVFPCGEFRARGSPRLAERPLQVGALERSPDPGERERREPATDVCLDGDEMTADVDDGDAGHPSAAYIRLTRSPCAS